MSKPAFNRSRFGTASFEVTIQFPDGILIVSLRFGSLTQENDFNFYVDFEVSTNKKYYVPRFSSECQLSELVNLCINTVEHYRDDKNLAV